MPSSSSGPVANQRRERRFSRSRIFAGKPRSSGMWVQVNGQLRLTFSRSRSSFDGQFPVGVSETHHDQQRATRDVSPGYRCKRISVRPLVPKDHGRECVRSFLVVTPIQSMNQTIAWKICYVCEPNKPNLFIRLSSILLRTTPTWAACVLLDGCADSIFVDVSFPLPVPSHDTLCFRVAYKWVRYQCLLIFRGASGHWEGCRSRPGDSNYVISVRHPNRAMSACRWTQWVSLRWDEPGWLSR